MVKPIIIIATLFFVSCADQSVERSRENINSLLKTGNICDEIEANFLIGESKDTLYLNYLFQDMDNPKICSGRLQYKGMSVYQSKMIALRKIANLDSQIVIAGKPDSTIIKFFIKKFGYE